MWCTVCNRGADELSCPWKSDGSPTCPHKSHWRETASWNSDVGTNLSQNPIVLTLGIIFLPVLLLIVLGYGIYYLIRYFTGSNETPSKRGVFRVWIIEPTASIVFATSLSLIVFVLIFFSIAMWQELMQAEGIQLLLEQVLPSR